EKGETEMSEAHVHVDPSNKKVALFIAILALVLAFAETLGKGSQTSALASHIEASNLWAFFQAKTIRQTTVRTAAEPMAAQIAQKRADAEDLLEGAQGRSVRVADEVLVAVAFGKRRYHDHSDRTVGKFPFVPGDEHRAAAAVGRGIEDRGQVLRQPGVALAHGI